MYKFPYISTHAHRQPPAVPLVSSLKKQLQVGESIVQTFYNMYSSSDDISFADENPSLVASSFAFLMFFNHSVFSPGVPAIKVYAESA